MLTIDIFISIISLCLTSIAFGFALGYAFCQFHTKK